MTEVLSRTNSECANVNGVVLFSTNTEWADDGSHPIFSLFRSPGFKDIHLALLGRHTEKVLPILVLHRHIWTRKAKVKLTISINLLSEGALYNVGTIQWLISRFGHKSSFHAICSCRGGLPYFNFPFKKMHILFLIFLNFTFIWWQCLFLCIKHVYRYLNFFFFLNK